MTTPTSSGPMLITDSGDPHTVLVTASKLQETNVSANVTVNNGKVSVSFPGSIWLHNVLNHDDSAQLSISTITQQ